jgi:hypothetical protein
MPPILDQGMKRIIKELQCLISFVCFEALHLRKSMTVKDQSRLVSEMYLGGSNPNQINQSFWFCSGEGRFAKCFKRSEDGTLSLIPELTSQEPNRVFQVSTAESESDSVGLITLAAVRRKTLRSPNIISEESLFTNAKTVMKNCKLAYSLSKQLLDADGNLRSGCNLNDFLEQLLDIMYVETELTKEAKKMTCAAERDNYLSQKRKLGWVFTGYMAFVMYGPLAIDPVFKSNNILNVTGK